MHLRNLAILVVRASQYPSAERLAGSHGRSLNVTQWRQISAVGFFLSTDHPVEQIDSPDFYPDAPWAVRCLRMCIPIMLFRFRYVRTRLLPKLVLLSAEVDTNSHNCV